MFDIGSAIGGVLQGIGSIVGGVQTKKAQESANRTNLQIARENNELSQSMFNQQLQYNSFGNQRKMLEDAGYSPYALFGTSLASAPGSPNLQQAQMLPETGLGEGISNLMGNLANTVSLLSAANKSQKEATKIDIENKVLPYMLDAQYKGTLTDNDMKLVQLEIARATKQDNVDLVGLQKRLAEVGAELTQQQVTRAIIENAFEIEYGGRKREKEIDSLAAKAFKDFQDGNLTSKEIQYLPTRIQVLLRQIKVDEQNASTSSRAVRVSEKELPSRIASNYAAANQMNTQASLNHTLDLIEKRFGSSVKDAQAKQMRAYAKLLENQNITETERRNAVIKGIDLCNKQIEYFEKTNNLIAKKMWMEILTGYTNAAANTLSAAAKMVDAITPF